MLSEALSAVLEAIRDSEAGSTHPASPRPFCSPTENAGIYEISSAQQSRLRTAVGADQGPPSAYFPGAPADQRPEVLAIASRGTSDRAWPEHGPCLVGDTVTLDDVFFTTKIAIHSGGDAIAPYRCTALLDTGSPQTFIRRDVLDRMLSVGAASSAQQPSLLGWFWRIRPFTDRDPHPSERSILPRKRTDVLSRGVGMRGSSIGHATRCLAGPRQLHALQHPFVPRPAPSSPR